MMRFLLALVLIQFAILPLTSCTSPETDEGVAAIDDGGSGIDDAAAATDDSGAGNNVAADSTAKSADDDLEGELDSSDTGAKGTDQSAAPADSDKGLDQELSDSDQQLEPEKAAPAKDQTADELQEAPAEPAQPAPPAEAEATPAPTPTPEPEAAPAQPERAKVRDIRYMSNANGGTVVIETSKPVTYQTRMNAATHQFVIEMADVELPPALQRPYQLKQFNSKFGSMNAYQSAGSSTARVVIQLSPDSTEPIIQQEGTSLVVIPPAAAPVASTPAAPAPQPMVIKHGREQALSARTLDEFLTGNQKFYGKPISLQVKDADIRDVVNFLAEESGANIVMSDDVGGKISLKMRKVPWDQALVTVMRTKGLGYVRQGNVLRISSLKALQSETEAANKIIEEQKKISPLVVQVIPISYSDLTELVKSVTPFLSKDGKVVGDKRSNTLIITDKSEVVDRVGKLVKTLDIQPPQVSIESKIVEAVEGFESFVGVNWGIAGSPVHLSPSGGADGAPIDMTLGVTSTTLSQDFTSGQPFRANLSVGTLDIFGNLTATLTLAEKNELAKVISAPRISTLNREKSTIVQQGENVAVITTEDQQTHTFTKQEKRTPFKLELSVEPQVTADGSVIMDLEVQREFLGPVVDAQMQSRAVNTRKAKTKVLVRNGQTAVIGGIYTSEEAEATNGVPGLMNIPVIGWLFKTRSFTRSKNELLIFLTPRVLPPDAGATETAANN